MMDYGYNETLEMNLRDSLEGIVKGQNGSGLYIDLKVKEKINGEYKDIIPVFGYWAGRVPNGTKVLCSIKRWAKEDKDILVNVDSVAYEGELVA